MGPQLPTDRFYSDATKFLEALLVGVPDKQFLEIRTLKKSGGASKNFYALSTLREQGFSTALPNHLDGKENVYYGVAPRYESRKAETDADRGDAVKELACLRELIRGDAVEEFAGFGKRLHGDAVGRFAGLREVLRHDKRRSR